MQPLRDEPPRYPAWGNAAREETLQLPERYIDPAKTDGTAIAAMLEDLGVLLHNAFGRDGVRSRHF
uniref:hypothetical protein n=1 Tax=Cupriavidus gilardii TaxID=82541 RepID=UPI00247AA04B|nr:hypothetical protein [Cupriavidus gilardii]